MNIELGQIAGRAGRYKQDGTFSYTKEAGNLDPLIIQQIETHNFEKIQKFYWRNSNLDFSSIENLLSSLKKFPIHDYFIHKKNALDEVNLRNLINDREVVLAAVNNDGRALGFASDNLRNDRDVVLAAVRDYGYTLLFASPEIRAERDVVLAAVNNYGRALLFASDELRADKELVINAISKNWDVWDELNNLGDHILADDIDVLNAYRAARLRQIGRTIQSMIGF